MDLNDLLEQKNMTKYKLSQISGVSFTTISEITTGKSKIKNCTVETVYKLAKALDLTIDDLISSSMEYRPSFETYKSNVCHMVKEMGDIDFIINVLKSDEIRKLYDKKRYPESLYLLAMVDYLSRENDLPVCSLYNDIRKTKLKHPIYPAGIIAISTLSQNDKSMRDSYDNAIPEFKRFNIVENEVRNVY